jgi:hypothetical protein
MPSPPNITNITPPRVPLIDERTGLISREWYRFFLNLFNLAGGGTNTTSLTDLQLGPPAPQQEDIIDIIIDVEAAKIQPTQESALDQIAELAKQVEALSALPLTSWVLSELAELQSQIDGLSTAPALTPIVAAALTEVDDTNVTLTLNGSPTTALLAPVTLTLGWAGQLAATRGGTGFGSYAVGDTVYANTTTSLAKLSIGAANRVLTSSGTAPQWSTGLALTSASSIEVTDNVNAALRITQLGTGNALLIEDSANPDSTPFVVTADGRIITGTTQAYSADGDTQQLQVHGLTQASSSALLANWSATATSEPNLAFAHSRSGVVGTHTASILNDNLGNIIFCGSDGSAFGAGVAILAEADGTWSGSSTPAKVTFFTVASGSTSGSEALLLTSGQGVQIYRTAVTSPVAADGNVFSGTYTPSLTNTTNIASSTAAVCQYMRVGNVVTVSGTVTIDPTATGRIVMGMTLPIASAFATSTPNQCGGTFASSGTTTVNVGSVAADGTNDRATFDGVVADAASRVYGFSFTYLVI